MTESNQTGNGQSIVLAGRIVGMVRDHELVKRVQESKHLLRSPRGWAVDAYALSVARTLGAIAVRIEDTETGKVYRADLATIDAHGYRFNRGYGDQVALQLKFWQLQGAPTQQPLFA